MSNFAIGEAKDLQHAEGTGQIFEEAAINKAWRWSEGRLCLVNASAREAIEEISAGDHGPAMTYKRIDKTADDLVKGRNARMDFLLALLNEPKVKRFIEPMLAASEEAALDAYSDECGDWLGSDLRCRLDPGLLKMDGRLRPRIVSRTFRLLLFGFGDQGKNEKRPRLIPAFHGGMIPWYRRRRPVRGVFGRGKRRALFRKTVSGLGIRMEALFRSQSPSWARSRPLEIVPRFKARFFGPHAKRFHLAPFRKPGRSFGSFSGWRAREEVSYERRRTGS